MKRPSYGIDAPPVIRWLVIIGVVIFLIGYGLLVLFKQLPVLAHSLFAAACIGSVYCLVSALWMFWSSLIGKLHVRDQLIARLNLQGHEKVLDVGCGRGLLLIGAAGYLKSDGKAVGIDLWREGDLSNNCKEHTLENARRAGVLEQVEVVSGDMMKMSFEDASFDVIVSSMAIHNIPTVEGRKKAIQEIVRVLKPGGQLALLDFQHTKEYRRSLQDLGWQNVRLSRPYFMMFPPVRIVTGKKVN